VSESVWRDVGYLIEDDDQTYRYNLVLPEPLASWDVWAYWERERTESMAATLIDGDVLFDVGTEHGWQAVVYSYFVGAENMVLVEPESLVWPNIRNTWKANGLADPLGCFWGFFGDETDATPTLHEWPESAFGEMWTEPAPGPGAALAYRYLHDQAESKQHIPQITVDDYVLSTDTMPDALTIDVEGAELAVLRGAEETLRLRQPLVWCSVHEDLMEKWYGHFSIDLYEFMKSCGYRSTHLGYDHEHHWFFEAA